jgi:hypothetical protein
VQVRQYWLKSLQGRNVVLEQKYGSPKIVNDGVTVAREVELEDPVENIGAKLVRQVHRAVPKRLFIRGMPGLPVCGQSFHQLPDARRCYQSIAALTR